MVLGVVAGGFAIGYGLLMSVLDGLGEMGNPQGGGGFSQLMDERRSANTAIALGGVAAIAGSLAVGIVLRARLERALRA